MKYEIHNKYIHLKEEILAIPSRFEKEVDVIDDYRNVIKIMDIGGVKCNVKMFKPPHLINQIAYAYIRKSKAERSYLNAEILLSRGVLTPDPVAYIVYKNAIGVTRSFYVSVQLEYDFRFRELLQEKPVDLEDILIAFTRFTHDFQQKRIFFKDHSQGNTLIKRAGDGSCDFYLVDLNRISYRKLTRKEGIVNFSRLGLASKNLDVVSLEYAKLTGENMDYIKETIKSNLR